METRLELLEPSLVKKIKLIDPVKRRAYLLEICRYALAHAWLTDDVVNKIMADLESGAYPKARRHKMALEGLLDELESRQLALRKQVNAGEAPLQDFQEAYALARAANTLLFALDPDSYIALTEATYEAYSITQDLKAVVNIIN